MTWAEWLGTVLLKIFFAQCRPFSFGFNVSSFPPFFRLWNLGTMSGILYSPYHKAPYRKKDKNVKKLGDICLQCIGENLASISGVCRYLAPVWKETLLQRLVNHDKLTPEFMPFITYNLFSKTLRNVEFYKSGQVVDSVLKQLRDSGCVLHSLVIRRCKNVTG